MAESNRDCGSDSTIKPYQFEPVHVMGYSESEEDGSESEMENKSACSSVVYQNLSVVLALDKC